MHKLNHLHLEEIKLPAGLEWLDPTAAWRFVLVRSGAAYWLGGKQNRPLAEGEVIIIAPQVEGVIRASQIGDVTLQGFNFTAEMLCGFFTLTERHFFEKRAGTVGEVRFLPSTHPIAQQFAASVTRPVRDDDLHHRVDALGIVAAVFQEEMARHQPSLAPNTSAPDRFQKIIASMPETEFINHTPEELARLCGCSPRHFNRLFQRQFGVSARARQTELRLLKSRQLLASSDEKIIYVAQECGYRNLSLFNALFKKRFGMTPSTWRKKSAKLTGRIRRLAGGAALAFLLLASAAPAAETNAAPAAKAQTTTNAPITFQVDTYELDGNTILPLEILEPIFKKYVGEAVTFEMIRQALSELQMAYRARGYVTVSVALPQQQLTNGIVQVTVTEGRLVDVQVKGNRHFSTQNILRALPTVQTNALLNGLVFQQQLDRANANSDRQIYPVISPGPTPGTSALELRVKDRLPLHLHFELNNYNTPDSPDLRMNLSGVYNNLWQLDHQIGGQYSFTPSSLKEGGKGVPNFAPYDEPLIDNYSLFYRMPLAPVNGSQRNQLQYSANDFGYDEAARRFRPPPLTGGPELIVYGSRSYSDTGTLIASETVTPQIIPPAGGIQISDTIYNRTLSPNEDIGARLSKPLPPLGKINSSLSFGLDWKSYKSTLLQNREFQARVFVPTSGSVGPPFTEFSSPPISSSRSVYTSVQYLPFSLDWSGSVADKFGSTVFALSQRFNWTGFLGGKKDFQRIANSTDADGNYYVVTASLTRDQKIWHDWGVRLHADGQWANQPLISNEQFGLGGNAGVRGYYDGQQYGDTGWRVQFEPHTPYINLGLVDGTIPMLARIYTFLDYGQTIPLNSRVYPGTVSQCGTGFGVDANIGEHWDFRLMIGVPLIGIPNITGNADTQVKFSLNAQL